MYSKILLTTYRKSFKWATSGWCFFLCENIVLSEKRTSLISFMGETNYYSLYGTLSTIAMAMIGYGYFNHVRNKPPFLWRSGHSLPLQYSLAGYVSQLMAWCIIGQIVPTIRLPTALNININNETSLKVRCPFDFSDRSKKLELCGINRVTNHPGLWAFGLQCFSWSLISPSIPTKICLGFPLVIAYVGGKHSDSRRLRGIGESWNHEIDGKMGHVPFQALLSGKQGDIIDSFKRLGEEIKGLNLIISIGISSILWAVTKRNISIARINPIKRLIHIN